MITGGFTVVDEDTAQPIANQRFRIIREDGSDSAMFDNCLEFLVLSGRQLPHAVMMMIPEPWSNHESMSEAKKSFYEYHSTLMEPWDGPASIAFTDGTVIGAVLDRNGLRPSRYYLTHDDRVIMASEVGVLPVPPETVAHKGRLKPGEMMAVDTQTGELLLPADIDDRLKRRRPYKAWLDRHAVLLQQRQRELLVVHHPRHPQHARPAALGRR